MIRLSGMLLLALVLVACGTQPGGGGDGPGDSQPVAHIDATPVTGTAPLQVQFSGAGSRAGSGVITSHRWDFGDGTAGAGVSTSHTYAAGTWTATLTVTDSAGGTASSTVSVTAAADDNPDPGEDPDPNPDGPDAAGSAVLVYSLPGERQDLTEEASNLALGSVYEASRIASGGTSLVLTGTLTQSGDTFTYSPDPADRLLVSFTNGNSLEIQFGALDGNFEAASGAAFLRSDHELDFILNRTIAGVTDGVRFTSGKQGTRFANRLQGEVIFQGERYSIDLTAQGTYKNVVDVEIDYESDLTVTGRLSGPGVEADISESTYYRYFMFDNAIEIIDRSMNSSWTQDGVRYAFQGVRIRRHFFNGKPSALDEEWRAGGNLLADGTVLGTFGMSSNGFKIDTWLQIGSERTILHEDFFQ